MQKVRRLEDEVKVRNALVSVSDRSGLEKITKRLIELCPNLRFYTTGGTHDYLQDTLGAASKQHLVEMRRYTTRPQMRSGLARTIDYKIYIGLLADPHNDVHVSDISQSGAVFFDLVICNMLPFEEATEEKPLDLEKVRATIDIGGLSMIRAAARNFLRVATVVDPNDYDKVINKVEELGGKTDFEFRLELARKAFKRSSTYDAAVSTFLDKLDPEELKGFYSM